MRNKHTSKWARVQAQNEPVDIIVGTGVAMRGRLDQVMEEKGLTNTMMAQILGVPVKTWTNWKNGSRKMPYCVLVKLHDTIGVDLTWLLTGERPKLSISGNKDCHSCNTLKQELQEKDRHIKDLERKYFALLEKYASLEMAPQGQAVGTTSPAPSQPSPKIRTGIGLRHRRQTSATGSSG